MLSIILRQGYLPVSVMLLLVPVYTRVEYIYVSEESATQYSKRIWTHLAEWARVKTKEKLCQTCRIPTQHQQMWRSMLFIQVVCKNLHVLILYLRRSDECLPKRIFESNRSSSTGSWGCFNVEREETFRVSSSLTLTWDTIFFKRQTSLWSDDRQIFLTIETTFCSTTGS